MSLRQFFRTISERRRLRRYEDGLKECCHFVAGPDFLVREAQKRHGSDLAVLPPSLLPDYEILGYFDPDNFGYGNVTFHHFNDRVTASDLGASGADIRLYPQRGQSPDALWSDELGAYRLCRKILLGCLGQPRVPTEVPHFAFRWILTTDEEEVKQAPIFQLLNLPLDGVRLTLAELQRARTIRLVDPSEPRTADKGTVLLEDSARLRRVLKRCNLNFEASSPYTPHTQPRAHRWSSRIPYFEPAWGHAKRKGDLVTIPIWEHASLVIDTKRLKLRTPIEGAEGPIQLDINSRLRVSFKHEERRGDTKVHEIHLLTVSDGKQTISYRARFKDYYEGGPVQAELDEYQDKARTILFRLAAALKEPAEMAAFRKLF